MESNDKLEELLRQMYALEETPIDIDKEWHQFEAKQFKHQRPLLRIAAIFIGVLMISSITFVAIRLRQEKELQAEYALYEGSYIIRNGKKITDIKQILPILQGTMEKADQKQQRIYRILRGEKNESKEIPTI